MEPQIWGSFLFAEIIGMVIALAFHVMRWYNKEKKGKEVCS